jgi:hypothetical protein
MACSSLSFRYVIALKVPKFSGYKPGIFYDTAEPQRTALLTPGKQSGRDGFHDLLVVAGEAHDQVGSTDWSPGRGAGDGGGGGGQDQAMWNPWAVG